MARFDKLMTAPSYIIIFNFSLPFSIGSVSLLSSWVKSEKLASVEIFYVRSSSDMDDMEGDLPERHRLAIKGISREKFRSLITDTDWTNLIQQPRPATALTESICDGGTFTLEPETGNGSGANGNGSDIKISNQRPMSASVCSNRSTASASSLSFNR